MDDSENYNGNASDKKRKELSDAHMEHLIAEKQKLNSEEFPLAHRLVDEELKKTQDSGKASFDDRYIDLYNNKPVKVVSRVMFPTKEYPAFNFVGKLLGPKGGTLKQLQELTKCRMLILGKGSMRDKKKEEELRKGGDSKYSHLSDELHVEVSCVAPAVEAHNRIAYAMHELQAVLVPDPPMDEGYPPYMDDGPMMRGGMRGPMAPFVPNPASKAKVMGFLEKARQSMEYQPPMPARRFGAPRAYMEGGYQRGVPGMKYTNAFPRTPRKARGSKRSLDDDSDRNSDHSSDSGLELDHQVEVQLATRGSSKRTTAPYTFEEESNAEFCFPTMPGRGRNLAAPPAAPLSAQLSSTSRDGRAALTIVSQPEQQHRARYQTEGSRGAVKDRTGNGFPIVKLTGYSKNTTLQIFVGTDVGRVAPHMFYQACRVSGKNSTPCVERKIEGTVLIEVDLDPSKDMLVTCDCVGILKERNVDVEHRFPEQSAARNKKKSTRCRMVFRAGVFNADGSSEVLQVCSQPIVCTQPPGIPEICKKSLATCPATGGAELFVLGKNFLKDTRVVFQNTDVQPPWEEAVLPDKEFLQQNHLVCVVPPYCSVDITDPVTVKVFVTSSGKASDPHTMVYVPQNSHRQHGPTPMETQPCSSYLSGLASSAYLNGNRVLAKACSVAGLSEDAVHAKEVNDGAGPLLWPSAKPEVCDDQDAMMPPPPPLLPLRRPSLLSGPDRDELKAEMVEELSQHSMSLDGEQSHSPPDHQGVDLSMKPSLFSHLSFAPPQMSSQYLKAEPGQQFPILYENEPQQFMEDVMMRPPPSKVQVRDFASEGRFEAANEEAAAFSFGPRVRSGSFTHGSSLQENSMTGFETLSRVRSASMSHAFGSKGPVFSQTPLTPLNSLLTTNVCSLKDIDSAMSSVVKQAAHELQPSFLCMPPSAPPDTLAPVPPEVDMASPPLVVTSLSNAIQPTSVLNAMVMGAAPLVTTTLCEATNPSTRALDAMVNCAADTHITHGGSAGGSSPSFVQAPASQLGRTTFVSAPVEPAPVPVTVSEISRQATQSVNEMALPPGPAPPLTGMVPQEMVKMTDHDLISYINPSCFDQV